MNTAYSPGTHQLLTLQVEEQSLLTDLDSFLTFAYAEIKANELHVVGVSSHAFDGGGFTAAICLMESHICIHTWPEFGQLTLDIYLCNYLQDNTLKVHGLGNAFKKYFRTTHFKEVNVNR